MTPQLSTKYVFTITALIGGVTSAGDIGHGVRRIIPVIGGEVRGEGINGKVCAFGADFQIIRPNELIELEAKYAFETDDGAVVYVENKGIRFGPVELLQRLKRGEPVDPKLIYFRTVPKFETGAAKYRWLMEHLFVGIGGTPRRPRRARRASGALRGALIPSPGGPFRGGCEAASLLTPTSIVIKYNYSVQDVIKAMGNAASVATTEPSALLRIETAGPVLSVGLNRPAKRNALNDGIILALQDCFSDIPEGIGAVVIHGVGDHFSSGLDLSELTEHDATDGLRHSQMWHRVFDRIQYSRVPVIAALRGAVIGGGLELACAAHIRVAEPSAYFALPEGQRGIFVGGGGSVRLPRLIGVARMTDMMLTGRVYSATEGASYGFAQYLTEKGNAYAKAMELANQVAKNAPLTNFAVLQALPMIAEANPQTGLLMESLMATVAQSDKEAKLRIRAFLDRKTAKVKPT